MGQPDHAVLIGKGDTPQFLDLALANRHGLIAGATGTGKTVSLQVLAEGFSEHGVPVFMADVKGDLSGISQPGQPHPKIDERVQKIGPTDYRQRGYYKGLGGNERLVDCAIFSRTDWTCWYPDGSGKVVIIDGLRAISEKDLPYSPRFYVRRWQSWTARLLLWLGGKPKGAWLIPEQQMTF